MDIRVLRSDFGAKAKSAERGFSGVGQKYFGVAEENTKAQRREGTRRQELFLYAAVCERCVLPDLSS
jgi:hypothetical protein